MGAQSWEDILHLTTGWSLVKRDDVTKVAGDSGIPWVNMAFKRGGTLFDSNDDFFALIQPVNPNKGFHFEFFTFGGGDARKWRLDITYLDNPAFHGYWEKASRVLSDLVYGHSSIKNEVSGSTDGAEADGVRLSDFAKLAKSFDDAGRFFDERIQNLQDWKDELGNEQAGWKGNAAGAFWLLLDDLHKKYENYLSQLRPPGFTSTHTSPSTNTTSSTLHGDNLIGAEEALYKAYQELYRIYGDFYWQRGEQITTTLPDGSTTQQNIPADPLDVLNQVFVEMGRWIIDNNARQWAMGPYSVDDGEQSGDNFYFTKNFKQESQFGALSDTASWHNLVNEAVSRWVKNVEINLDKKAQPVLETLQKDWSRVLNPSWNSAFSFTDAPSTLTSDVQDENNEKNGNDLGNGLKGLGDGITKLGDGITNGFKGLGDGIGDGFKGLGDGMGNNFKALGDGIGNHVPTVNGNGGFGDVPSTGPNGANVPGGGNVQVPKPNIPNIQGNGGFGDLPTGNSLLGGGGALGGGTAFHGGLPISNIDGSTTTRSGGGVLTNYPNGSKVMRNADGSITSAFSDGSTRTVTPDGAVTTVDPKGHSTTSHLGVGESVSNPDGTSITRNGDGSLTQTAADGTKTTTLANGTSKIVQPNGETQLTSPDGTVSHVNSDGSLTTDGADGSKVTVHPNGDVTTVDAKGHSTTTHLGSGESVSNADGSTVTVDGKGNIVTHNPDGSTTTLHRDGTVTTTQATANNAGTYGGGRVNVPSVHVPTYSGGGISYTPDGTSITRHPGGATEFKHLDGSSLITTSDGRSQVVPSPANLTAGAGGAGAAGAGAGVGAGAAAGVGTLTGPGGTGDSQNAMGLLSPMMMMAGMNRMNGQQGGQGGGDRERNLYDGNDMDGAVVQHGMSPFAARADVPEDPEEWEEEETDSDELLGPRRPSTESAFGPPGGSRQSPRSSGKDLWGTEEGGLPASIGH